MTILATEDLSIAFGGVRAVDAVSLRVPAGGVFSVIGPNGAGKTTLFNLISGIYAPAEGSVRFAGEDVTGLAPDRARPARPVAHVPEPADLLPHDRCSRTSWSAATGTRRTGILSDLLHLPAVARQNATTRAAARAALARVGLAADEERPAGALVLRRAQAAGDRPRARQRAEAPAARRAGRRLQPGRDRRSSRRSSAAIVQDGVTVVLVEHDMRLVMNVSDRIHVLANGRTLAEGTAAEVRADPNVIEAYLGVHQPQDRVHAGA